MQLKTADHKCSNVLEPILNPEDVTIPPNDHIVIPTQSQIYAQNAVTGILQPSDLLHEEGDITFCAVMLTLHEKAMRIHVNIFTDQPYKLKKGMHFANFSVMTPEQMKYVRPIDPVSTWHLLNENEDDAIHYISSLLKANRNNDQYEQYGSQHLKIQETKQPIPQYNKGFSENYETCMIYNNSIRMMMRSPAGNFSAILTGKTQCYNSMRLDK